MSRKPPTVINIRTLPKGPLPPDVVYIGRTMGPHVGWTNRNGSLLAEGWENIFKPKNYANKADCLRDFEAHFRERWRAGHRDRLQKLSGKRLACWCAPGPCHGDVLVKLWLEQFEEAADE